MENANPLREIPKLQPYRISLVPGRAAARGPWNILRRRFYEFWHQILRMAEWGTQVDRGVGRVVDLQELVIEGHLLSRAHRFELAKRPGRNPHKTGSL